jgi:hypothetical protein
MTCAEPAGSSIGEAAEYNSQNLLGRAPGRFSAATCHEHIGQGHLGLEPFQRLVNDPRFGGVLMCLETEPGPEMRDIAADLR